MQDVNAAAKKGNRQQACKPPQQKIKGHEYHAFLPFAQDK